MKVTVKLYALLGGYLPDGATDNQAVLELAEGATPRDVMAKLNVPPESCHLILINGHFVPPSERESRRLDDGDVLAMWPPVAGGAD